MEKAHEAALARQYAALKRRPPKTKDELRRYIRHFLNYGVPSVRVCDEHVSPMEYLWHAYSIDLGGQEPGAAELRDSNDRPSNGDCIVWANRGGGKTQLAAVATLLEGLFKPMCRTLILAGSLDQSGRMYDYLCDFVGRGFAHQLDGRMLGESCRFANGSTVQALAQSSRAVRGRHVHKLRCDEVELFDEEVFNAAKFVTHSTDGKHAAMEMFSTMHRPYGLMQKLIDASADSGIPVFKWCVWEVIERCRPERSCSRCVLNSDCGGKARRARGYLKIDDVISQMRRSSRTGFETEMLCLRPNLENAVFAEFEPAVHVRPTGYDATLPLYRAMDFGFVNPFVCLWVQTDKTGAVRVIDEYVQARRVIADHARAVRAQTPCGEPQVEMTFCDPAGSGPNDVTGTSAVRELRALGFKLAYRASGICEGIELIRAALRAGDGQSRLAIDPKCRRLIEALRCYHYPDTGMASELPEKDGIYDHPVDALRYFFVNYCRYKKSKIRRY
ncbi:MAG: hypothetical protein L0Y36_08275 [Planctomycetales bacterium]|nr:hypothetical protein [Planctomycetales bacterium]